MRLTIVGVIASPDGFQSTHSCRVRLPNRHAKGKQQSFQSTHSCRVRRRCHVSVLPECRYFNPRTRVECDRMPDHSSRYVAYFNPRTRVECDAVPDRKTLARIAFQSTHSCRVRRTNRTGLFINGRFQSTHSCRVRHPFIRTQIFGTRFQSTHSCRVRPPML